MSFCEYFPIMTRLSSQGKRFALVTVIQGEAVLKYIISDGRVIYGGTDPVVLELGEKALAQSKVIEVELRDGKAVAEPVEPRPSVVVVGISVHHGLSFFKQS
jgi:xanthine dehydrogenase accessory factor